MRSSREGFRRPDRTRFGRSRPQHRGCQILRALLRRVGGWCNLHMGPRVRGLKRNAIGDIASRPCQERKDGAPSVEWCPQKIKAGPPAPVIIQDRWVSNDVSFLCPCDRLGRTDGQYSGVDCTAPGGTGEGNSYSRSLCKNRDCSRGASEQTNLSVWKNGRRAFSDED